MVEFFEKWQTLIGAVLGGVIALAVALIVARSAQRQEQETAAMILIGEMRPFFVAIQVIKENFKAGVGKSQDEILHATNHLLFLRPKLSPLFYTSMPRIMTVDRYLASHLAVFRSLISDSEQMVSRIEQAKQMILAGRGMSEEEEEEIRATIRNFVFCLGEAAKCVDMACPLLQSLFLDRHAWLNRLERRSFIPQAEQDFVQGKREEK